MLLRISEKITGILVENKIITQESREIYRFGVQQGIMLLLNFFTLLIEKAEKIKGVGIITIACF